MDLVNSGKKVVVAMSGGVDSSVAAALLVKQGYQVMGLMMRLWSEEGYFETTRDNRCCTRDQMLDAHRVAKKLGIPFQMIDARETFKREVVDRFIQAYSDGVTPNPCLSCNRHIRFTFLLNEALKRGADYLATGHYARITQAEDGRFELRRGADAAKDQSYVLSVLTQAQMQHVLFPVGVYTKPEVRALAEEFGLPVASKAESQDLCFVADGSYTRFLQDHAGGAFQAGPIRLRSGQIIGEHGGLPAYTIGQRKGLGVTHPQPLYVLEKDVTHNALIVGTREELGCDRFDAIQINWLDGQVPVSTFRAEVKTRYKARPAWASITPIGESDAVMQLDEPAPDITPGQGAVIYDGDRVIGSGIIR